MSGVHIVAMSTAASIMTIIISVPISVPVTMSVAVTVAVTVACLVATTDQIHISVLGLSREQLRWIKTTNGGLRFRELGRGDRVDFVEQHLVREGHLLCWLVHGVHRPLSGQLLKEMSGIHNGDDAINLAVLRDRLISAERVCDGAWVSHARRFNQNAIQDCTLFFESLLNLPNDLYYRFDQVVPKLAAETPVVQHRDRLGGFLRVDVLVQKHFVDGHVAELVFDHSVFLAVLCRQNVVQEGRLPCTEKSRQHCHRDLSSGKNAS